MNNAEIIFNEALELMNNGIIGTTGRQITIEYEKDGEKVKEIVNEPEPIHTYAEWKKEGFQVQKGQKAIAKFTIWMYTDGKKHKKDEEPEEQEQQGLVKSGHYYMKQAAFFKASQVEPAKAEPKPEQKTTKEEAPELEQVSSLIIDDKYIDSLLANA